MCIYVRFFFFTPKIDEKYGMACLIICLSIKSVVINEILELR